MADLTLASMQELDNLGFRDILNADPRPTFVVDLDPDSSLDGPALKIRPLFCNTSLCTHESLFDAVSGNLPDDESSPYPQFKQWVTKPSFDDSRDAYPQTFIYANMLWTGSTVKSRWRIVSGNLLHHSRTPIRDLSDGLPTEVATGLSRVDQSRRSDRDTRSTSAVRHTASPSTSLPGTTIPRPNTITSKLSSDGSTSTTTTTSNPAIKLAVPEQGVSDWTSEEPARLLTSYQIWARSIDWAATSLGSMKSWTPSFRQIANLVLGNPHPAALFWGSELTMLYNEAYAIEVAGQKHPALMGTGFSGPFSETWSALAPIFADCARTGLSVRRENHFLPINRSNYEEETYFSWSFTPLYGGTPRILGFYNAPFESTKYCVATRRTTMLRKLGEALTMSRSKGEFFQNVLVGLEDNHFDVPFALLYSVVDGDGDEESTLSSGSALSLKSCVLEGSIAVPVGHAAAPQKLDLKRSVEGFVPSFREAMRTREPTKLQTSDGTLPEALLQGINFRGHGRCREAIIFPIRPTNEDTVLAFLLVGVNSMRAYDDEYESFTAILNRQLATSLASVVLFEDEMRRSRNAAEAAAAKQESLTQQLAIQTSRLRRMAEVSPLGMYYISPAGQILEANDRWYEVIAFMTGLSRDGLKPFGWLDQMTEASQKMAQRSWDCLTKEKKPWSGELQLYKKIPDQLVPDAEPGEFWVLATSHPELDENGSVKFITGSLTDISHLKWAQGLQNRRLQEAEETRRQQNEFIDITSHEMRNPLSAILQCADDISSSLEGYQAINSSPPGAIVDSCIEAANTIALCVQHQKSIVDDILTISKLDSNLLLITPVPVQPIETVKQMLKIFEPELQNKNIKVVFTRHPSLDELHVDWLLLDPARLLQILINLMTNAIKFTAVQTGKREINVHMGASCGVPDSNTPAFDFVPLKNPAAYHAFGHDWPVEDVVHMRFKVEDTGCGLAPDEKEVLFQRFSQASPRTHAVYGGSGLGLFISRQLAELHGGQIGCSSTAGVGSTFGFFIKTRRPDPALASCVSPSKQIPNLEYMVAEAREEIAVPRPGSSTTLPEEPKPFSVRRSSLASSNGKGKALHILVVEDNLVNQKVLVTQLRKAGCEVSAANNGLEALAHLAKTDYQQAGGQKLSVILMDLEMPLMDGLTCVRKIREMEASGQIKGHVPTIAVTANVRDQQIQEAKTAGMDDVQSKPFRTPDVLTRIEKLLDYYAES